MAANRDRVYVQLYSRALHDLRSRAAIVRYARLVLGRLGVVIARPERWTIDENDFGMSALVGCDVTGRPEGLFHVTASFVDDAEMIARAKRRKEEGE